jgi:Fic-DOC domain mobile mystery protein B
MENWEQLPGETPITDFSELKVKGITTKGQLNVFEAENIRKALVKYLARKPTRKSARFDYAWSLQLHREMFGEVWKWGGRTRTSDLTIGVPWNQVEPRLYALLGDLAYWKENGTDLLEQAVVLHHRAVEIHPFLNGNGRWSRMLANIWLKLHDHPLTVWPEEAVGAVSPVRKEYIDAIKLADQGDYEPLKELHRRFTTAAEAPPLV